MKLTFVRARTAHVSCALVICFPPGNKDFNQTDIRHKREVSNGTDCVCLSIKIT